MINPTIPQPIRVVVMSDPHLSCQNERHLQQWQNALLMAKNQAPDLYLIAGDLTEKGLKEEAELFKQSLAGLDKPCLFVPGNHDLGNKRLNGKEGEISSLKIKNYRTNFGPDFLAKNYFGWQFICLNSQLLQSGLKEEKKQWEFFKDQLAIDCPKIILMHTPLYINSPDEAGGSYWNAEPEIRQEMLTIIRDKQVLALISGHLHRLVINQGVSLFLSVPPLSFGLPDFHLGQSFLTLDLDLRNLHWEMHSTESLYTKI